jgi:hypothetical protein
MHLMRVGIWVSCLCGVGSGGCFAAAAEREREHVCFAPLSFCPAAKQQEPAARSARGDGKSGAWQASWAANGSSCHHSECETAVSARGTQRSKIPGECDSEWELSVRGTQWSRVVAIREWATLYANTTANTKGRTKRPCSYMGEWIWQGGRAGASPWVCTNF